MQCKKKEEIAASMSPFRVDWVTVSLARQTRDREVEMDKRSGTALNQRLKTIRTRPPTEDCPHPKAESVDSPLSPPSEDGGYNQGQRVLIHHLAPHPETERTSSP
jgi:hypothetical protein